MMMVTLFLASSVPGYTPLVLIYNRTQQATNQKVDKEKFRLTI